MFSAVWGWVAAGVMIECSSPSMAALRYRWFAAPHAFQDVDPVAPRQPEVEERKVVDAVAQGELGLGAIAHPVHRVAGVLEAGDHRAPDHGVVFDEEDSHAFAAQAGVTVRRRALRKT